MKLKPLTVIGLNSGTSMDGVDAAIFRIAPKSGSEYIESGGRPNLTFEMLGQVLYEFEPALRQRMKALIAAGHGSLDEICRLDAALGEEFARAALALMRSCPSAQVNLIGSHGQTIWHSPQERNYAGVICHNTLQLGQTAVIAERTGIPVIGDFRVQDMAVGGQGAPLVSYADEVLFAEDGAGVGVLNIGGIANITVLDKNGTAVMAFDTGPGNMLIDRCAERFFDKEYDDGGKIALSGKAEPAWLKEMLTLNYFNLQPPKTTGRELFGIRFADELIAQADKRGLSKQDTLATIAALTPASIAYQYERFVQPAYSVNKIILGGGGAENEFILAELKRQWPHKLELARHEDYGISTKFKEALLFALLAYTSYFRIPNNVPACTGAFKLVCLGKMCLPS